MTRVAIAVPLWSDDARTLIRAGAAFAESLNAVAIAVLDRAHELRRLPEHEAQRVRENTELVASLGAAASVVRADILVLGKALRRHRLLRLFRAQNHVTLMFCGVSSTV